MKAYLVDFRALEIRQQDVINIGDNWVVIANPHGRTPVKTNRVTRDRGYYTDRREALVALDRAFCDRLHKARAAYDDIRERFDRFCAETMEYSPAAPEPEGDAILSNQRQRIGVDQ